MTDTRPIAVIPGYYLRDYLEFRTSQVRGAVEMVLGVHGDDGVSTLDVPLNKDQLLELAAVALNIARRLWTPPPAMNTYTEGDKITIGDDRWVVDKVGDFEGRPTVRLVNPSGHNRDAAYFSGCPGPNDRDRRRRPRSDCHRAGRAVGTTLK